jgi:hypothetical protein
MSGRSTQLLLTAAEENIVRENAMRRVLRDSASGLFYAHGVWTADVRLADVFSDLASIEKIVQDQQIQNAEMILVENVSTLGGGVRVDCPPPPAP